MKSDRTQGRMPSVTIQPKPTSTRTVVESSIDGAKADKTETWESVARQSNATKWEDDTCAELMEVPSTRHTS